MGQIVCLVENDAELRAAMCQLLDKWGFEVIDVETAEEVPALLQEIGILPDLFLVGFQLGEGMNGLDLIRTLRRLYGAINARIITANRSPAIRDLCTAADIGVLHKPIRSDELAAFLSSGG